AASDFGVAEPLRPQPAAWAGWFDRRSERANWPRFIRGLALFAWLRGLRLGYLNYAGQTLFGVAGAGDPRLLGLDRRPVPGAGGDLAWDLLQAYLDAGAPWPTEYAITAPSPETAPGGWVRLGPRLRQAWRLPASRGRPG